eukprot:1156209-Pelagomonas_calceolata.AAC.2
MAPFKFSTMTSLCGRHLQSFGRMCPAHGSAAHWTALRMWEHPSGRNAHGSSVHWIILCMWEKPSGRSAHGSAAHWTTLCMWEKCGKKTPLYAWAAWRPPMGALQRVEQGGCCGEGGRLANWKHAPEAEKWMRTL